MKPEYTVILVDSTSHALRIEKCLVTHSLSCKLIPVPRHLSSDCGVCVRVLKQDVVEIKSLLRDRQIEYQSIEVL